MSIEIKLLENYPDQKWDDFVYRHAEGTFFHLSPWATVIHKAFKHKPYYLYAIDDGEIIKGKLPKNKMKLVQAWIEIHREELMADWKLAVNGQQPFKIDPLK